VVAGDDARGLALYRVRLLHVIPSVSERHGGPSQAIKAFAKASKATGIEVTVATTDDDGDHARLDVSLGNAIEQDGVPHFFFRRDLLPYKVSFGLQRWLNEHIKEFDVVHIHALFSFSSTMAARIARQNKVPYVVRPLGVLNQWGIRNRRRIPKLVSLWLVELPRSISPRRASAKKRLCLMHAWQNMNQRSFLCRSSKEHGARSKEPKAGSSFWLGFRGRAENRSYCFFRELIERKESSS